MDGFFEYRHAFGKVIRQVFKDVGINLNPQPFHFGQDRHQRAVQRFIDACHMFLSNARFKQPMQAKGDVGIFGGIVQRLIKRDLIKGDLGFARPANLRELYWLVIKMQVSQFVHAMSVAGAIKDIGQDHGVIHRGDINAMTRQNNHIVFQVLTDFQNTAVLQQRFDQLNGAIKRDLFGDVGLCRGFFGIAKIKATLCAFGFAVFSTLAVPQRDVTAISWLGRK